MAAAVWFLASSNCLLLLLLETVSPVLRTLRALPIVLAIVLPNDPISAPNAPPTALDMVLDNVVTVLAKPRYAWPKRAVRVRHRRKVLLV